MKKPVLALIVILLFQQLPAQVTKGNFLLGGSVSFESKKYTEVDDHSTLFVFAPDAGYFFADKVAAGLRVSITGYKTEDDSYRELVAGPFARYYFLPVKQKTNVFFEANFMAGAEKYKGFASNGITQFGFAAGPSFFLNPNIAIEATVNWRSLKYEDDPGRYNTLGIAIGLQIHWKCPGRQKDRQ